MSVTSDNMSGRTLVMVAGLALAAGAFFVTRLVAPFVVDLTGWNSTLVGIGIRTILAVVCFVALGGASWLRFDLGVHLPAQVHQGLQANHGGGRAAIRPLCGGRGGSRNSQGTALRGLIARRTASKTC